MHRVTKQATILTLKRSNKQKANHKKKKMFTSEEQLKSKVAKDRNGKRAMGIVLMKSFLKDVVFSILFMIMGSIVQMLRLVDKEK